MQKSNIKKAVFRFVLVFIILNAIIVVFMLLSYHYEVANKPDEKTLFHIIVINSFELLIYPGWKFCVTFYPYVSNKDGSMFLKLLVPSAITWTVILYIVWKLFRILIVRIKLLFRTEVNF